MGGLVAISGSLFKILYFLMTKKEKKIRSERRGNFHPLPLTVLISYPYL